jgi:2-succinyl-6-hydroxy-2,4-cyclohexadiene-1-carboxylate synthase
MTGRLAFIHGFTQTARSWEPVAAAFADRYEAVLLDAPGHGAASQQRLDLDQGATALARAGGRATYVGYSMGGRLALHIALDHPHVVDRLVLVSATPGIVDADDRARRRAEDEQRARTIEEAGVDAFVDAWLSLPMFAGIPDDPGAVAERKRNTASGLASSLRLAGTGTQRPLWARLGELAVPVLLVAGGDDPKFARIARAMHGAIPTSTLRIVAGAGHAVPLERPDALIDVLDRFLGA